MRLRSPLPPFQVRSHGAALGVLCAASGSVVALAFAATVDGTALLVLVSAAIALMVAAAALHRPADFLPPRNLWDAGVMRMRAPTFLLVSLITTIGATTRVRLAEGPIRYDEAYTYMVYVRGGVDFISTRYDVPNNQILNSLLIKFSDAALGTGHLSLRLPALAAGLLLIPAMYFAGRTYAGCAAGVVAAAVTACAAPLITYSVNGRGYSLVCLATAIMIATTARSIMHPRDLAARSTFVVAAVVGSYAVPVAGFAVAICLVWQTLHAVLDRRELVARLAASTLTALVTAALISVLYLPTREEEGWQARGTVDALPFMRRLIADWTAQWPDGTAWTFGALLLVSIVLARADWRHRLAMPLAVLLVGAPLFWTDRVPPFERTWLFVLPFVIVQSAAGVVALVAVMAQEHRRRLAVPAGAALLVGVLVFALSFPVSATRGGSDPVRAPDGDAVVAAVDRLASEEAVLLVEPFAELSYAYDALHTQSQVQVRGANAGLVTGIPTFLVAGKSAPDDLETLLGLVHAASGDGVTAVLVETFQSSRLFRVAAPAAPRVRGT